MKLYYYDNIRGYYKVIRDLYYTKVLSLLYRPAVLGDDDRGHVGAVGVSELRVGGIYTYIYIYIYTHIHIHICIHIFTHIYIYIYIYTNIL